MVIFFNEIDRQTVKQQEKNTERRRGRGEVSLRKKKKNSRPAQDGEDCPLLRAAELWGVGQSLQGPQAPFVSLRGINFVKADSMSVTPRPGHRTPGSAGALCLSIRNRSEDPRQTWTPALERATLRAENPHASSDTVHPREGGEVPGPVATVRVCCSCLSGAGPVQAGGLMTVIEYFISEILCIFQNQMECHFFFSKRDGGCHCPRFPFKPHTPWQAR